MRKSKYLLPVLTLIGLVGLYQNCGQTPFGALSLSSEAYDSSSYSDEPNIVSVPYALLSAEQVFKSMSSVTNTPINSNLMNEYNNRQSVLGSGFDLKLMTSPMLIAVTNLGSVFCNETLNREAAQPVDARKLFSQVDFTKPAGQISESAFQASVQKMSLSFWGREPSEAEMQILTEGKTDFMSALTASEASQASTSKNFMLYTCTAILSSFDSLSF